MAEAQLEQKGLSAVEQIYHDRSRRARQLRDDGKKIVGYFCAYPPLEMLTASELVPYRIMGKPAEPVARADEYLESIVCSFVRSCFDVALKGDYNFLDGFVASHACDNIGKIYTIWRYNFKPQFSYFVNVPNTTSASSIKFFRAELDTFKRHLEDFTGIRLTDERLSGAIKLHNENRALMRQIYALRKPDPPLLSAVDMNKILVASQSLPVDEANRLLRDTIDDIEKRRKIPSQKAQRIMVVGSEIDDSPLFDLIENSGANVVIDDTCIGTRVYWYDVAADSDPMDSLVTRYLDKVMCPRTYRERTGTREEDLNNRFGHILSMAREFGVNGVILYILRYCDNFGFDVPDMRDYLEKAGIPVLHIEDEYLISSARLRTQVEAFLEMIG